MLITPEPLDALARRVEANWTAVSDDPDQWAPVMLGRYHLDHELGRGSFGVVISALDLENERDVAVKVFYAPGPRPGPYALPEARALVGLRHPNIITLHDYGREGPFEYLVFELVDGVNLGECMHALDWRETLELFVDAGHGLAAVHRAGLVHCDVKPSNILVGSDGRVVLADFGAARQRSSLDDGALPGGTRAYMPPERFLSGTADARGDQFALCVSIWEGLFGGRPWSDRKFEFEGVFAGVHAPIRGPLPAGMPVRVERTLRRGLAAQPSARYGSVDELLRALVSCSSRSAAWGTGLGRAVFDALTSGIIPCRRAGLGHVRTAHRSVAAQGGEARDPDGDLHASPVAARRRTWLRWAPW